MFSLHSFPPDLGGKKLVGLGGKFSPGFPTSLFSFASQIVENTVFHTIFHPLFSILPIIPPTKHSVKVTFQKDFATNGIGRYQIKDKDEEKQISGSTVTSADRKSVV